MSVALGAVAAPAAPAAGWAVVAFGACAAFVTLWALSGAWKHTFGAFLQWLGNLGLSFSIRVARVNIHPFSYAHVIDRNVRNYLSSGMAASERAMVYALSQAEAWLKLAADTTARLAQDVYDGIRGTTHAVTKTVTQTITHTVVKPVTRTVTKLDTKATTLLRSLNADVARLQHRMTALAHTVEALPARVGVTPKQIARLGRRTSELERKLTLPVLGALSVAALSKLGYKWLFCRKMARFGNQICNMPSVLVDALLAGLTLVIATEGLVPFARQVQGVIGEAEPVVRKFWRVGVVGQGGDRALGSSTLD